MKYFLHRKSGFIAFNSYYNGNCIYWLSFLTGALADFVSYCDITKKEFFEIWDGRAECSEVFKQFRYVTFCPEKEYAVNVKYGLKNTIALHQLPSAQDQDFFKSELEINE